MININMSEKLERAKEIIRTLATANDKICYECIDYMKDNCDICNRYVCNKCNALENYCNKCVNKYVDLKACKICQTEHANEFH